MPSRNVIKDYASEQFYHAYNRGVAKQPIFLDDLDKNYFLKIVQRYLDINDKSKKSDGSFYRKFNNEIELICYCLMDNHFHFLLYTLEDGRNMSAFMQSVMTAYTMYFNKRHERVGTLFQGVFKASRISHEVYLQHITRYIHLNPKSYKTYPYSSYKYYIGVMPPAWFRPDRIRSMFKNREEYIKFIEDYKDEAIIWQVLKHELADQ